MEAARDGRLTPNEVENFSRHTRSCDDCAREQKFVEDLGRGLRSQQVPPIDQLSLRRLRGHVLEAADEATLAHGRVRPHVRWESLARLALVLTFIGIIFALVHERPQATTFVARDLGGARWSAHDDGSSLRVDLLEGLLELRVDRPAGGKRVVLHVPDGEIEDIGTTFRVSVARGRTERIDVDEGKVIARIGSEPAMTLGAGEHWSAPPAAASPRATAVPVAALPPAPTSPTANVTPSPSSSPKPIERPKPSAEMIPPADRPSLPPTADEAATESANLEDRAYVEVLELLRTGRTAEAREAAKRYVARFPNGFRRKEMERLGAGVP
ncbi:hypothetical protein AKJ09_01543 [Labilithrix luteola]|uniref:FecR protein domain-containing protein n=1 Tax=Labilithrix luteola TaxID=1391654 RepID=A0A0K1PP36_9BACT|nr:hypothetical protein AKJ09_01543 [Labilithrix luteola]